MNIWNIARVELRRYLRDVRLLSIMLAFPIVLMLILGVALSGSFHMETKIGEMRVLYSVSSAEGMLPHAWSSFIKEAEKAGVRFVHAPDPEEGLQEARRGRFTGYVEVASDGLSYSGSHGVENQIVHGVLAAFTDRYKSAAAVASVDSSLVLQSNPNHENYIREVSLTGSKQPRALDYYAVSLTAMMVLFGSIGGSLLISSESKRNTTVRLLASPVTKGEIFGGKLLGALGAQVLTVLVLVAFSRFVFQAEWGNHIGWVLLLFLTEMMMALSIGIGVGFLAKEGRSRAILMIIVQLSAILGGTYYPVSETFTAMSWASAFSPLHWMNRSIFQVIYADNVMAAGPVILLNLGIAVCMLLGSILYLRKKEGL